LKIENAVETIDTLIKNEVSPIGEKTRKVVEQIEKITLSVEEIIEKIKKVSNIICGKKGSSAIGLLGLIVGIKKAWDIVNRLREKKAKK
jgi:hypothetical protein